MTSTTKESYVYVGGEKGGVARKRFGEGDWELLTNGLPDAPVVIQISVNPKRPEVVFVGTRDGAYRSVDNGNQLVEGQPTREWTGSLVLRIPS